MARSRRKVAAWNMPCPTRLIPLYRPSLTTTSRHPKTQSVQCSRQESFRRLYGSKLAVDFGVSSLGQWCYRNRPRLFVGICFTKSTKGFGELKHDRAWRHKLLTDEAYGWLRLRHLSEEELFGVKTTCLCLLAPGVGLEAQ